MMFVAYDVCHLITFVAYEYDVFCLMIFVAYDFCRTLGFQVCRFCRSAHFIYWDNIAK